VFKGKVSGFGLSGGEQTSSPWLPQIGFPPSAASPRRLDFSRDCKKIANKKFYLHAIKQNVLHLSQQKVGSPQKARIMAKHLLPTAQGLLRNQRRQLSRQFQKNWYRWVLAGAAAYLVYAKDLAIDLELSNAATAVWKAEGHDYPPADAQPTAFVPPSPREAPKALPASYELPANVSTAGGTRAHPPEGDAGAAAAKPVGTSTANKRQKQQQYVKRFATVAQTEMEKFGIPASITLAQGLLESNVGESKLAVENNNHFGIKCFSKSCKKGHCSNHSDDTHKDFFRKYNSAWESYRAHSQLLKQSERYRPLFNLKPTDYRGWAKGLKEAGYATDPTYAEKLISLIEELQLHRHDR
jgi:flagellum-specific peptidoglycan hydrolase FlgJ